MLDDTNLVTAALQAIDYLLRRIEKELQVLQMGVQQHEFFDDLRQKRNAECRRAGKNNPRIGGNIPQAPEQLLFEVQHQFRFFYDDLSRFSRNQDSSGSIYQAISILIFKEFDSSGDCRLGNAEILGSTGKAASLDDFNQRPEINRFHPLLPCYAYWS